MFEWAFNYEELYRACTLFNLTELANPKKFSYKFLKSYIQEGPQCGLVALAMACEHPCREFVEKIFETAHARGFTRNGELFSSKYLKALTETVLPNQGVSLFEGQLDCEKIREHLIGGDLMLVPYLRYDADKNNSPGCFNGHKAHWAVLCGAIETENDFYAIAKHGKSKNLQIWSLESLSKSNEQLNEFSPDRKLSHVEYILPEGGLNGPNGLKRSAIVIRSKK